MRSLSLSSLVLALPLLATGCIPESNQPISDPTAATQQTQLHGLWVNTSDQGDKHYLHVGAEPEKPLDPRRDDPEAYLMRMVMVSQDADGGRLSDPLTMRFFVSEVGEHHFANLVLPYEGSPDAGKSRTWWFVRYELDGDVLRTRLMDLHKTAEAIEAGQLAGKVEREEQQVKSVLITDSSANLERFLAAGGALRAFPAEGVAEYRRVR